MQSQYPCLQKHAGYDAAQSAMRQQLFCQELQGLAYPLVTCSPMKEVFVCRHLYADIHLNLWRSIGLCSILWQERVQLAAEVHARDRHAAPAHTHLDHCKTLMHEACALCFGRRMCSWWRRFRR